uniref:Membrane transport protein MMPL domain-containing protein n=1 Tax=Schlesneria paludicola TaxID=360056 RepID=A0A7C2P317_9PLAN
MPHFFERRDIMGNSPAIWVTALMLFIAPLAWWSLKQTRLENDVENWLSADDPQLKALHWAHEQFPVEEQVYVTWDGSSLGDPRIDRLIALLEPQPDANNIPRGGVPYVEDVVGPREILARLQSNGVAPHESVRRLEGVVLGAGPLRVRLTESARKRIKRWMADLPEMAQRELGIALTIRPAAEDLGSIAMVPGYTAENGDILPPSPPAVLDPWGALQDDAAIAHDLSLTWKGMRLGTPRTAEIVKWLTGLRSESGSDPAVVETCFFVPGAPVTLAVALSEAGLADKPEALQQIRQAALEAGIPPADLKLGGSAVASTELNREVMNAAWNPAFPLTQIHKRSVMLTSALVGAVLAFVMVRSLRLSTIVLAGAIFTTFFSVALVPATGGAMNMVLVVMPTLLLVVTLSGGIHIANYWRHAAANDCSTAVVEACRMALRPCLLAAFTTAVGLASLCTSSLSPVRDFGLYSSIGTMLSFLMVLFGIPSLLLLWPGKPPHDAELDHPGWRGLGTLLTRRPSLQVALSLLVCAAASFGLTRFQTETKVIRYFPESSRIVQDYWFIENNLAGIVPIETIIRFDESAQDEINFLDRMEMVRDVQERIRKHAEITGCIALADFLPVANPPETGASLLATSRYHKRANTAESRIRDGEYDGVNAFYTVAAHDRDLLSPGDRGLMRQGDELWRITAQVNVMTDANYAHIIQDLNDIAQDVLRYQPGADHVVTGTVPLFLRTQQAVLDSLITSSLLAFVVILAVFIVQLRSIAAGLVAMIPNIVPITVVFGLVSFAGVKIDIGTMITASIALGMAVDGTLHFLEWYQQKLSAGLSQPQAVISTVTHCGPAVWQTSWVVALGLLVLVPAELLLISRFGWLMAAMVGVAMLGDIVLLPQILASPLGRLFQPRTPTGGSTVAGRSGVQGAIPEPQLAQIDAAAAVRMMPR